MAKGAIRLSAADFLTEVEAAEAEIRRKITADRPIKNNQLLDNLDPAMANWLEMASLHHGDLWSPTKSPSISNDKNDNSQSRYKK